MKPLAEILGKAIGRKEVLRAARAQAAFSRWDEAVGGHLSNNTKPDRYDQGILWFTATGSAWSQEAMLHKEVILSRMNELAGEQLFDDLRASRAMKRALE